MVNARKRQTGDGTTDDDLSPETLIDEERPQPADKKLSVVDESAIGEGFGKDEAELAEVDPVGSGKRRLHADEAARDRGPGRMHSRNASKRARPG